MYNLKLPYKFDTHQFIMVEMVIIFKMVIMVEMVKMVEMVIMAVMAMVVRLSMLIITRTRDRQDRQVRDERQDRQIFSFKVDFPGNLCRAAFAILAMFVPGMHAPPRPQGKWLLWLAPALKIFKNALPRPPRKCPEFNLYPAPNILHPWFVPMFDILVENWLLKLSPL